MFASAQDTLRFPPLSYDLRNLQTDARFDSLSGEGIVNAYDGFGRLVSSANSMGGTTRTLSYQYDRDGSRTRITHPDSAYFTSAYDGLDRPVGIADQTTTRFIEGYNQYGTHTGVLRSNGTFTNFGYDGVQRLNAAGMGRGFPGYIEENLILLDRNASGQLSSVTINNNAYTWTGHRAVQRAYTTNGLNQYSAAGVATLAYDANGNLISETAPDPVTGTPVTTSYVYDIENRLVGRSGGVTLAYDPLGRLFSVSSTTPSASTTQFLYDGDALVGEYVSGTMTKRYVHRLGADVPVMVYSGTGLTTLTYLHPNHQGSIIAVSDGTGAHAINTYDEYGIPGAANSGRFQYTGQIWLPEIGMYHYKARVYSPTLGRFLQTDPIGYADQFNFYAYVGNDPVNGADPSGMKVLLTGQEEDRSRYLEVASRLTGLSLREQDGLVVTDAISAEERASLTSTGLEMLAAIEATQLIGRNAVYRDPDILIDSFDRRTVDIGDIESLETRSPDLASAAFGHQIGEYRFAAVNNTDITIAHMAGENIENARMGALRRGLEGQWRGPNQTFSIKYYGLCPAPLHTFTFRTDANGNF